MWRDVFLHNKPAVLEVLGHFIEDLFALQRAIRWDNTESLFDRLVSARSVRREVVRAGQAYKRVPLMERERTGVISNTGQPVWLDT